MKKNAACFVKDLAEAESGSNLRKAGDDLLTAINMRQRMKLERPNKIVRTIRKTPVFLLKHVFPLLGSRE